MLNRNRNRQVQGFILRKNLTANGKQFLSLFTKEQGLLEVIAQNPQKFNHRLQGKTELLSSGIFQLYHGRSVPTITAISNLKNTHAHSMTYPRLLLLSHICQLYCKVCPHEQPIHGLFQLLEEVNQAYQNDTDNLHQLLIYFLPNFLNQLGISTSSQIEHAPKTQKIIHYADKLDYQHFQLIKISEKDTTNTLQELYQTLMNYTQSEINQPDLCPA